VVEPHFFYLSNYIFKNKNYYFGEMENLKIKITISVKWRELKIKFTLFISKVFLKK